LELHIPGLTWVTPCGHRIFLGLGQACQPCTRGLDTTLSQHTPGQPQPTSATAGWHALHNAMHICLKHHGVCLYRLSLAETAAITPTNTTASQGPSLIQHVPHTAECICLGDVVGVALGVAPHCRTTYVHHSGDLAQAALNGISLAPRVPCNILCAIVLLQCINGVQAVLGRCAPQPQR
jgi:hypothetical protein